MMAFDDPPYVVEKTEHSARLFRRQLQQSVGEGSGVSRADDLKVSALNVPGNGFRVAPGGGVAQSRDTASSARESYGPVNNAEIVVTDVPGTGSGSGRRDLVILEITDPAMQSVSYPKPTAPDYTGAWLQGSTFAKITVIFGVLAGVKSLEQITTGPFRNVTGVTLAAINWPASTSTITSAMIEDLRKVQNPRRRRGLVTVYPTGAGTEGRFMPTTSYNSWPLVSEERPVVDVPVWATKVRIVCTIMGARFSPPASGESLAGLRTGFASTSPGQNTIIAEDAASTAGRHLYAVVGTHAIPASLRGTAQAINVQAVKSSGGGVWIADYQTSVLIDYEFSEDLET